MHKQIWIRIEKAEGNYAAYAPAVPGCIATGDTVEQTRSNMIEALEYHLDGMLEDGDSIDALSQDFPRNDACETGIAADEDYYALVDVTVTENHVGV